MKVTGIISALVFAHVAMGQASDSTSASVSTTASVSGTKSANAATASTKTGTKSASASSSSAPDATPTGSTGSTSLSGPLTETVTGDSNPLIPADISAGCSTFLTSLNSDTTISGCLTSLNTALSSFTSGSGSASAAPKTLTSLCSTNSCSASAIRSKLTEFKDACSDELTSNDMVAKQYDVWWALMPFKEAICTKDDDGQTYCLSSIASSSSNTSNARRSDVNYAAGHLTKRTQTVLMPNSDTYRESNLMFLFISPNWDSDKLCTSCAQKIISGYIKAVYANQYALGIPNSPLLKGEAPLYAAMQQKCTPDFMQNVTSAAGVPDTNQLADGAVTTTASYFTALAAAFAAAFALF